MQSLNVLLATGIALVSRRRSDAILTLDRLEEALAEALALGDYMEAEKLEKAVSGQEWELRSLGIEMTPEELSGQELTPDEKTFTPWLTRAEVGGVEFGDVESTLKGLSGWTDDDGNADSVEFSSEMDGDWWEAQFSADSGLYTQGVDELGKKMEMVFQPNWDHIRWVASKRDALRDEMLNRVDAVHTVRELEALTREAGKYSAWAMCLNKGKRVDNYNQPITNHGLDYRRYAIVINKAFRKACELKGHSKAINTMAHLLYTDVEEKADRESVAKKLNDWASKSLGKVRCAALLAYPETPSKEGDIMDHSAQLGEHEMESSTFTPIEVRIEDPVDLAWRVARLPKNLSFKMAEDDIDEWMRQPLRSPLTQKLEGLFSMPVVEKVSEPISQPTIQSSFYCLPSPKSFGF